MLWLRSRHLQCFLSAVVIASFGLTAVRAPGDAIDRNHLGAPSLFAAPGGHGGANIPGERVSVEKTSNGVGGKGAA